MIAYMLSPFYVHRLRNATDVFLLVCVELFLIDLPAILSRTKNHVYTERQ
jgi:hypothetical protein